LSLNLEQKQAVVAEVAKVVAGAQAIVLAENRGLPVAAMTQLRAKARTSGVYFRVVKNTLVRRAVAETPFAPLADRMVGPLAYGIGSDPVAVDRIGYDIVLAKRIAEGLQKEGTPTALEFMLQAERLSLGVADRARIDLREVITG